jgi:integrase
MAAAKYVSVGYGIYKSSFSGVYFHRPTVNGKRTWKSLETSNLTHAKAKLKTPAPAKINPDITAGEVIRRYQADDYPDGNRETRPERMHHLEESNCKVVLPWWDGIKLPDISLATCDRYCDWRVAEIQKVKPKCKGLRAVDLDLNTVSNAFIWAVRVELCRYNPLSERHIYCVSKHVKHCRDFMPHSADELHDAGSLLFENIRSFVLGFQYIFEGMSGLRTCEVLRLRTDAAPYEPGWVTPDGKTLCVRRGKGQSNVNPFCTIHPGLAAVLDASAKWRAQCAPDSPWYFPSPADPSKPLGSESIAHALIRISKKYGRKLRSHGARAFYVLVRRSNGASDVTISYELGHTTGGATIKSTYGGVPENWLLGDGPKLAWLPNGKLAWDRTESVGKQ